MKTIIPAALVLLTCTLAFADSKIDLKAGTVVTVNASEVTTVSCETPFATTTYFCACGGSYSNLNFGPETLIRFDIVDGQKVGSILANYSNEGSCLTELKLKTQPACQ